MFWKSFSFSETTLLIIEIYFVNLINLRVFVLIIQACTNDDNQFQTKTEVSYIFSVFSLHWIGREDIVQRHDSFQTIDGNIMTLNRDGGESRSCCPLQPCNTAEMADLCLIHSTVSGKWWFLMLQKRIFM